MNRIEEMHNVTCLGVDNVFPTTLEETGINSNEMIVGPTRSGKTTSIIEPRLLHTFEGSLVVNVTKRALVDKYAPVFKARGYKVLDLNFVNPETSNVSFDPMTYVERDEDILKLAEELNMDSSDRDPYWGESAKDVIAALIGLVKYNAEDAGRKATFRDLATVYSVLDLNLGDGGSRSQRSNIDFLFDELEKRHPGCMATKQWKTIRINAERTASCIFSTLNAAFSKLMTEGALKMMDGENRLDFKQLANEKTVLFITTSPVNKSMQRLTNLFFSEAFRNLFEYAESLPAKELPLGVHLICDDFATGCSIPDFQEYLSVFCAKKISVSLLIQSESQLADLYNPDNATTIINQCDTYVYFGGMDHKTCSNISQRRNIPIEEVFSMPLEKVMIFRRGSKPVTARRYQTYEDPLHKQIFGQAER